jgi:hypothetical protein
MTLSNLDELDTVQTVSSQKNTAFLQLRLSNPEQASNGRQVQNIRIHNHVLNA